MKKSILFLIALVALFASCKKDETAKPVDASANIQASIVGSWYYNSLDLGFYQSGSAAIYDEVATPAVLHSEPYFVFNKDLTGSYIDASDNTQSVQFTYAVSSKNGTDSLIFNGGVIARYGVKLNGGQISLSSSTADTEQVMDATGKVVTTSTTKLAATLGKAPLN